MRPFRIRGFGALYDQILFCIYSTLCCIHFEVTASFNLFLSCFHNKLMNKIKGVKKYYTSKVGGPLIANPLIAELESISGLAFSGPSFLTADLTSANR